MVSGTKNSGVAGSSGLTREGDRLLAFDIRPQRVGFVVLEGATQLVDWGTRWMEPGRFDQFKRRLVRLIDFYTPTTIVIRRRKYLTFRVANAVTHIARRISSEARVRKVTLRSVDTKNVLRFFAQYGCRTKHEIATTLAGWFEELTWKLPPKRKPWQSEHPTSLIFEALAVAITIARTNTR